MRYPETLKQLKKEIRESFESETNITVSSTDMVSGMFAPYPRANSKGVQMRCASEDMFGVL